jgi:phage-related protein
VDKPLVILHGAIKTPPLSSEARLEVGFLLRRLQTGEKLTLPRSRPMPTIGPNCHELRVPDGAHAWRVVYRIDPDAILIVDVFAKKTQQTPKAVIDSCRERLRAYDATARQAGGRKGTR